MAIEDNLNNIERRLKQSPTLDLPVAEVTFYDVVVGVVCVQFDVGLAQLYTTISTVATPECDLAVVNCCGDGLATV